MKSENLKVHKVEEKYIWFWW